MARGIYHETGVGRNDMVIHQDHRGKWRIDLVTSSKGNHLDVTGPNAGYESAEEAGVAAKREAHRRGIRNGILYINDKDDGFGVFYTSGPSGPSARLRDQVPNGRRTGILSDGTRVNVYYSDEPGIGDPWTVVPHNEAWDRMERGGMRSMLGISKHGSGISEWSEGQEGRHLGRSVAWDAVPSEIKRHIERRVVGESMVANGRASTVDETALRELDLYITNTYELVGAPNSIGRSIDANLKRKVESGKYDSALAPKAWQHLVDEGAKRYTREFGIEDSPIFSAATRRALADSLAVAWEEENGYQRNPAPMTAEETARYAARESVRATERFGLNADGHERAYLIGPNDQRSSGGRDAVLRALRAIASDEHENDRGDIEFWGRIDTGSRAHGGESWRAVVLAQSLRQNPRRPVPSDFRG